MTNETRAIIFGSICLSVFIGIVVNQLITNKDFRKDFLSMLCIGGIMFTIICVLKLI